MIRNIVFRCLQCRSTTSVQAEWKDGKAAEVICSNCNALFSLSPGRNRGLSDQDYYDKVRRYAAENNIDVSSSYSVLEGIMPRERVRTLSPTSPEVPRPSRTSPVRSVAYLAALLILVALLGNHLRHRWSETDATEAIVDPRPQMTRRQREPAPAGLPAERPTIVPVLCQTDPNGELTKVLGPDPRSVLLALAQFRLGQNGLDPVAIAASEPPNPGARVGVLRSRDAAQQLRAVRISLDPRSNRWIIGDGRAAVSTEPLERIPTGADAI